MLNGIQLLKCPPLFIGLAGCFLVLSCEKKPDYGSADFTKDVLPLLQQRCFECHGVDSAKRQAGLRLDIPNSAVIAGDAAGSAAVRMMEAGHPAGGEAFTSEDIRAVKAWIESGAKYAPHWIYKLTEGEKTAWPSELIPQVDSQDKELAQQWFDEVRALFPEVEVSASMQELFLSRYGQNPLEAKAKVVDELMAKGDIGKLMSSFWLGVVGDEGLTNDPDFERYRDWLEKSFHDDVPMLEVIGSQLTSDLIKGGDLVPTSFLRVPGYDSGSGRASQLGRVLFGEEGVETRVLSRQQRAQLALLFECVGDSERRSDASFREPVVELPSRKNQEQRIERQGMQKRLSEGKKRIQEESKGQAAAWLAMNPGFISLDGLIGVFNFDDKEQLKLNSAVVSHGELKKEGEPSQGLRGGGMLLRNGNDAELEIPLAMSAGWPWAISFWFSMEKLPSGGEKVRLLKKGGDVRRFVALDVVEGGAIWHWDFDGREKKAQIKFEGELKAGEWQQLTVLSHGGVGTGEVKVYVNGRAMQASECEGGLEFWPLLEEEAKKPWTFSGGESAVHLDEIQAFAKPLSALEVAHVFSGRSFSAALADGERWKDALAEYYEMSLNPEYRTWMAEKADAVKFGQMVGTSVPVVPVMKAPKKQDIPNPVLIVDPTRYALPIPAKALGSRRAFAEWYAGGDCDLAKRVLVNHLLKHFLGDGLLPDAKQREEMTPTEHVRVLDQLVRFADKTNWSAKVFLREMLIASYRSRS